MPHWNWNLFYIYSIVKLDELTSLQLVIPMFFCPKSKIIWFPSLSGAFRFRFTLLALIGVLVIKGFIFVKSKGDERKSVMDLCWLDVAMIDTKLSSKSLQIKGEITNFFWTNFKNFLFSKKKQIFWMHAFALKSNASPNLVWAQN